MDVLTILRILEGRRMFCNERLPLNKIYLSFLSFYFLYTLPARADGGLHKVCCYREGYLRAVAMQ